MSRILQKDAQNIEDILVRSLRKMWIVIISEAFVSTYSYLFTQVIYLNPIATQCNYFGPYIYNWATITNRLIVYIVWCVPIIYIFWPPDRTWYGTLKMYR